MDLKCDFKFASEFTGEVTERFLRYIAVGTTSSEESGTHPSSLCQKELAALLYDELLALGIPSEDVFFDVEHCYIYSKIRGLQDYPKIGFISHMDTSPEAPGDGVKPNFVPDYNGGTINLGGDKVLSPDVFPELLNYKGQTLITTDGTTLLGSDDKSGVAEIMTMASYFMKHPEIPHGDILIAFTPDEEIGEGTMFFDVERFGADYAYTVDGGELGELSYENFNAASACIKVAGVSVHPGEAFGKMVNAVRVAEKIDSMIPDEERPETTKDYQGFFHLTSLEGTTSAAVLEYIIRDHDLGLFESKKEFLASVCRDVSAGYGIEIVCDIKDTYYNMRSQIVPDNMSIVNNVVAAMERVGINPLIKPIRGGTDGATLSFKGLPCPNICAGGHNFHGVYEYVPCESMGKIVELLVEICKGEVEE